MEKSELWVYKKKELADDDTTQTPDTNPGTRNASLEISIIDTQRLAIRTRIHTRVPGIELCRVTPILWSKTRSADPILSFSRYKTG